MIFRTMPRLGFARSVVSYPDFEDWRARSARVAEMEAYGYAEATHFGSDGAEKWTGHRVTQTKTAYLCRCGHSKNKPFCDGSHKEAGFKMPGA